MQSFKDAQGRIWIVEINHHQLKRVQGILGIKLVDVIAAGLKGLAELTENPVLLIDIVYVLCGKQVEERGISDEDFGRAMYGDAIDGATEAFIQELIDFFPKQAQRASLKRVLQKSREMQKLILGEADRRLEAIDPAIEASRFLRSSNGASGNARESSGSTPEDSPSDNS